MPALVPPLWVLWVMLGALVNIFSVFLGIVWLGSLALFYQAFYQGQRMMRSLLGSAGEDSSGIERFQSFRRIGCVAARENRAMFESAPPGLQGVGHVGEVGLRILRQVIREIFCSNF